MIWGKSALRLNSVPGARRGLKVRQGRLIHRGKMVVKKTSPLQRKRRFSVNRKLGAMLRRYVGFRRGTRHP